ncbi:MAG: hypothetical protein IH914_10235 [candidate division Zixibacteria bacterium]|nr:hypothetical protein [candidate division Zixibacteria bacterium]
MKLVSDRLAWRILQRAMLGALALAALASCASREDVLKVEQRIIRIERQQTQTRHSLNQLDSLARASSSAKTGDFAQLAAQLTDMIERLDQLTASINEV